MFACIYIPNFSLAAALRAEPELQSHPLAVFEGKPPLEKIIAVDERAKQLGIAPGMTKAQGELCCELMVRPRWALQESSTHAALLDCAQSFSPCMEDAGCDTVLLDLRGMTSLFGSVHHISRAMADRAIALGLQANVAVASNADAAQLAARGFPGITVIPAGKEHEQLGGLPIEVLFSDRLEGEKKASAGSLLGTLHRWGIRNLRALAALPEVALSERLGQEGVRLQQLARGEISRTLVPVEAPLVFEEAVELEHPIVLLEPLAFLLNRLLEQVCARLGSRALSTQELRLTLELDNCFNHQQSAVELAIENCKSKVLYTRTLRLPLPMLDVKVFLKLLQLDLSAHPPGAPITAIHLAAEPARPRAAQGGLFLPPSPEPEKLELTLARIAGMVGEHKVGALELLDTHHPEGFRMRRFVAEVARKAPQKQSHDSEEAQSAITALRRFRPPVRAQVTLENGQPTRVSCRNQKDVQGEVLWRAGPWRFSGDWWDREAWSRDEWDLAVKNGTAVGFYRVVHDLLGGSWFLEGSYD